MKGSVGEEDPLEVIPKGKDHDAHEQHQSDLLREFSLAFAQGLPQDALDQEKKQVAAVKDRDGRRLRTPRLILSMAMRKTTLEAPCAAASPEILAIVRGPTDVFAGDVPHNHFVEPDNGQLRPSPCGFQAVVKRRQWIGGSHE